MKKLNFSRFPKITVALFFLIVFFSCEKKETFFDRDKIEISSTTRSEDQLIRDSIYYYYNLYSLWSDESIPDYNHLFRFSDSLQTNQDVLNALKKLTPSYPNYPEHVYDRFSFIQNIGSYTGTSAKLKMDINNGYGIHFTIGAPNDQEAYPIVYFVEGGSPGAKNGIKRSDVVKSINNSENLSIPIDCSTGTCKVTNQAKYQQVTNLLTQAMAQQTMQITLEHEDKKLEVKTLTAKNYAINPIIKDSIYLTNTKNVGYLAMSSFEEIENNNQNQQNVDLVFNKFENKQIKDLVVDLRYNTGGYVDAAIYIANKIIHPKNNNKLMLTYKVNKYLSQNKESGTFRDVYFQHNSQLQLETVYFLVTNETASAAEMLINVLKPYMNVQIIAENYTTYGKPVGFFQQVIMDKVAIWPVSFLLENGNGFSDYWSGLTADRTNVNDYVFRNFGDTKETMLAAAIDQSLPGYNTKLRVRSIMKEFNKVKFGIVNSVDQKGSIK